MRAKNCFVNLVRTLCLLVHNGQVTKYKAGSWYGTFLVLLQIACSDIKAFSDSELGNPSSGYKTTDTIVYTTINPNDYGAPRSFWVTGADAKRATVVLGVIKLDDFGFGDLETSVDTLRNRMVRNSTDTLIQQCKVQRPDSWRCSRKETDSTGSEMFELKASGDTLFFRLGYTSRYPTESIPISTKIYLREQK